MIYIPIAIPKGVSIETIAEIFTTYLLGSNAFNNSDRHLGPYKRLAIDDQKEKWQLDTSNNYWLEIYSNNIIAISWRYESQQKVVETMVALFELRYGINSEVDYTVENHTD